MKSTIFSACLLIALPAMAEGLDGRYSLNCSAPWETYDGRLEVIKNTFNFWESSCRMMDPVAINGMPKATLYMGMCEGEGDTWTDRYLILPLAQGDLFVLSNNSPLTFKRCN